MKKLLYSRSTGGWEISGQALQSTQSLKVEQIMISKISFTPLFGDVIDKQRIVDSHSRIYMNLWLKMQALESQRQSGKKNDNRGGLTTR